MDVCLASRAPPPAIFNPREMMVLSTYLSHSQPDNFFFTTLQKQKTTAGGPAGRSQKKKCVMMREKKREDDDDTSTSTYLVILGIAVLYVRTRYLPLLAWILNSKWIFCGAKPPIGSKFVFRRKTVRLILTKRKSYGTSN